MPTVDALSKLTRPSCLFGLAAGLALAGCTAGGAPVPGGPVADASSSIPLRDATSGVTPDASVDSTAPEGGSILVDGNTEDVPVTIVCPPAPPVDLAAVPGLIDQCTQLVYVAGGGSNDELAVSLGDATHWGTAFVDADAGNGNAMGSIAFGFGFGFALGNRDSLATTNGTSWTAGMGSPPASGFSQALAFVNDMFVYIGKNQGSGYSFDGVNWEFFRNDDPYSTGANATFWGLQVAYGNNVYVAVGPANATLPDGGSGPSVAIYRTSTDGQNWSQDTPLGNGLLGLLTSVAFGNGTFVVVGTSNGATGGPTAEGLIAWSTDATSWTIVTNDSPGPLGPMHFSEVARSDTLFVAASNQYSGAGQWWSPDGVTWTAAKGAPSVGHLQALEGHFIGGPVQGQPNGVVTVSDDGKTWTSQVAFSDTSQSVSSVAIGRVLKGP